MKQLIHNNQLVSKPVAAFEVTAIPVVAQKELANNLMDCLKTILHKSHPKFDFALEILNLGCKTTHRANGSMCRLILTIFAYGKKDKELLTFLNRRTILLENVLQKLNYTIKKLQTPQLEVIHADLQTLQYTGILAPYRGTVDTDNYPIYSLATDIPVDTAVSILFTRDICPDNCRVTSLVMSKSEKALISIRPYFHNWPMLRLKVPRIENYLLYRLNYATKLNDIKQTNKCINWSYSTHLLKLPFGTDVGMKCSASPIKGINFPAGMLHSKSQNEAVFIGYTEGKVPVSLTVEQMSRHICILGQTGSGKSTLIRQLISNCTKADMHVAVLDLVGSMDFRKPMQDTNGEIYTLGNMYSPYSINPLNIAGFSATEIKAILMDFFEKYMGLFDPIPRITKMVLSTLPDRSYILSEFISDFLQKFEEYLKYNSDTKSNFYSAIEVRLQSFASVFGNGKYSLDPELFFQNNHLFELHDFTETERTIFLAWHLQVILKYISKMRNEGIYYKPLVIIVDEIHSLLDNAVKDESKASLLLLLRRMIAEGRKLGVYMVIADQRWDLIESIIREVGNKFVLRTDTGCRELAQLLCEEYAEKHLPILLPGELYFRAPGMNKGIYLKVPPVPVTPIKGNDIHFYMEGKGKLRSAPMSCNIFKDVKVKRELSSKEDKAKDIAYNKVLIPLLISVYQHEEELEYIFKNFILEEILKKKYNITDTEMTEKVRSCITDVVKKMQYLIT